MGFLTKTKLGWTFVFGVLVLLCFMLLHKPLLHGTGWNHSYFFNAAWILEFNDSLHRGVFPPRWLFGANNGLGSPSFYYYPPMPFYVTALVAAFSSNKNDYAQIAAWGSFYMTLASGMAMFAWLRRQAGDLLALAGAIAYVFAPFHIIDDFVRGSMGETAAYMLLPLVALCVQRTARTEGPAARPWIAGLGLAYAGLLMCHVTIALLTSVSVLPAYGLHLLLEAPAEKRRAVLLRCVAGVALGIAIGLSYIGPAMAMQKYASLQWMFQGASYEPYRWTLLRPDLWPTPGYGLSMAYLGYGAGALGLAAILAAAGRKVEGPAREALAWGGATLLGLALYAVPWVWKGPLGQVQFPFRILVGMEFAAITAVVMAASAGRWLRLLVLVPLCLIPLDRGYHMQDSPILLHVSQNGELNDDVKLRIARRRTPDEHLPAGFDVASSLFAADSAGFGGFDALPQARALSPDVKITPAGEFKDGSFAIAVETPRPARVVLREFYFPTWEVGRVEKGRDPVMPEAAYGPERLLSFTAEPGAHTYRIRIVRSALEKVCDAISVLALLAALALLIPVAMETLKKIRKAAI